MKIIGKNDINNCAVPIYHATLINGWSKITDTIISTKIPNQHIIDWLEDSTSNDRMHTVVENSYSLELI